MSIKKIHFSAARNKQSLPSGQSPGGSLDEPDACWTDDLTVKFQITESQTIAHSYKRDQSLEEIRLDIAKKFKVTDQHLDFYQGEVRLDGAVLLGVVPRNKFGIVEIRLQLNETATAEKAKLDLNVYYRNFTLPEIITVSLGVDEETGAERKVLVEIENRTIPKPFLGGYRDPVTRIEYHNAFTQTGPRPRTNAICAASRDTQTEPGLMCGLRTTRTPRNEIRKFVSSDEMIVQLERHKKAVLIQRCFRAYLWRKLLRTSAAQWRQMQEKAREKKPYETANADYNKVLRLLYMEPKTKPEFEAIYAAIQNWKRLETMRLRDLHSDGPYIAELYQVLEREIFLLNEVDQRREKLRRACRQQSTEKTLAKLGQPKKFMTKDRKLVEIDSLRTQRVRFWTDFYRRLKAVPIVKSDRLTVLDAIMLALDETATEAISAAKLQGLKELFRRECQMWELNFTAPDMDNLRKRQLFLFYDFIQATDSASAHHESSTAKKVDTRLCNKCKSVLPVSRFILLGRKDCPDVCKRCDSLQHSGLVSEQNVYKQILRAIRRDERRRGTLASYAFIVQEDDIRFLVETIWNGHSILSQNNNRHQLRLPRWTYYEEWAPWNCVCLTESEAKTHCKLRDVRTVYEKLLLDTVRSRNSLAMTSFRKLKQIDYELVESGEWWQVQPEDGIEGGLG